MSQPSSIPGSSGDTSLNAVTPPLNSMVYVAAIAQVVRDTMAAEKAYAFCADSAISTVDIPQLPSMFGGMFGSQAAALLASGARGIPSHWPTDSVGSS